MKRMVVRYKAKRDRAPENQRLIEAVFHELKTKAPEGLRYLVLMLADGSFVHFVERDHDANPFQAIAAFHTFQAGIRERVLEPPMQSDAVVIGSYRMLRE